MSILKCFIQCLYDFFFSEKGNEKPKVVVTTTARPTPKPVTKPPKTKPFYKPKPSITTTAATTTASTTERTTLDPNIPDCSGPCVDQSDITTSCVSEYSE